MEMPMCPSGSQLPTGVKQHHVGPRDGRGTIRHGAAERALGRSPKGQWPAEQPEPMGQHQPFPAATGAPPTGGQVGPFWVKKKRLNGGNCREWHGWGLLNTRLGYQMAQMCFPASGPATT